MTWPEANSGRALDALLATDLLAPVTLQGNAAPVASRLATRPLSVHVSTRPSKHGATKAHNPAPTLINPERSRGSRGKNQGATVGNSIGPLSWRKAASAAQRRRTTNGEQRQQCRMVRPACTADWPQVACCVRWPSRVSARAVCGRPQPAPASPGQPRSIRGATSAV